MDLSFSEEQEMLRRAAREFLEAECPKSHVRAMEEDPLGYSPTLWKKMAELGWLGLPFPESYGGGGGSFLDLVVILEELGRALTPSPFLPTVVLSGYALLAGGTEEQKRTYLPQIARGEHLFAFALLDLTARYTPAAIQQTRAVADGSDYVINGTKMFVHDAHIADTLIVAARTGEPETAISLFLVPARSPGVEITVLTTVASDRQCEVVLEDVRVPRMALLGAQDGGWSIVESALAHGTVAECARMSGGAQYLQEITVEYAKRRVQFGKPIGAFQAIQHHCANMAVDVDGIRFATYEAAWR
ncbi:MAG: acyl-CoA/acyl-ACP dehydrogenase, partial [Dehalococcoidia bacterium]|nr:acyl-CoA/acyl-ACP dehydrogenase [Dehalococcoidia bacterium]